MIPISDFAKLDIRIGTITSAEPLPNADKLLKLLVDVGDSEPRQILAGIAEYIDDPATLVGMQCPFVVNLEPRVLRGEESQGMLLACLRADTHRQAASGDDSGIVFLNPSAPVPAGTKIR